MFIFFLDESINKHACLMQITKLTQFNMNLLTKLGLQKGPEKNVPLKFFYFIIFLPISVFSINFLDSIFNGYIKL